MAITAERMKTVNGDDLREAIESKWASMGRIIKGFFKQKRPK
jgi:hypothetical protein